MTETGKEKPPIRRDKNFNTRQQNATNRKCVFCNGTGHRLNDCTDVEDPIKRRQIMSSKKLCFSNMVIAQLIAQATSALNVTGSAIHHCVSTTNYKTTPAKEIKRQKKR